MRGRGELAGIQRWVVVGSCPTSMPARARPGSWQRGKRQGVIEPQVWSEKQWQGYVERLAGTLNFLVYHTYDSRRSNAGFPDLVMLKGRRLIFAELKTEKGRLRAQQKVWLEMLKRVPGIEVYLWRPSDIDEVERVLGVKRHRQKVKRKGEEEVISEAG